MAKCPGPNCKKRIATSTFACSTHWDHIPGELRERINKLYADYRTSSGEVKAGILKELRRLQMEALPHMKRVGG